ASRKRRLRLQTSYGQAMMWSKGFGAPETKAAFTRAKELAAGTAGAGTVPAILRSVGWQPAAWRAGVGAGDGRNLLARSECRRPHDGSGGSQPQSRHDVPLAGSFCRSASPP